MSIKERNKEHYAADRPIDNVSEDAFQRYGFAKRIAETITQRQNKDSIVFGLFGAWGEGKTSIINFIHKEISRQGDSYIQITFNPWRFTDEAALLTSFFNTLASEIKKSIPEECDKKSDKWDWFKKNLKKITEPDDEPLKTKKENIGDIIQKYGKVAAIFGGGEVAEAIGKAISNVDLDELKSRIEKLLEENKKRIIIYLDDIDRLDKSEIHSIFRLVKLTGDFSYTVYVLSFDQEMVASAIGERFGSGDKKAGESFLEKIIQVPLNIPKAQPDLLKKFCFSLVENALDINGVILAEEEVQRFVYEFTTNVLSRLTTPRLAVRYGNALSFSMPLLKGEVNMVDLMLIEALRVFYSEHYCFVKDNSTYFIGSYSDSFNKRLDDKKKAEIESHLQRLEHKLSRDAIENVKNLLLSLFPNLKSVFSNYFFSSEASEEWYVNKRIASTKYFDRYFSYSVFEGDISDVEFEALLGDVKFGKSVEIITDKILQILKKTTAENFLLKIRSREKEIKWDESKVLIKSLCNISDKLPNEGGIMRKGFEMPFGQAAIFVYQLFKNNKECADADLFEFAKELMSYPKQFEFAYEINNWLRSGDRKEERLFNDKQYQELAEILTKRAVDEAGDDTIFEKFSEHIYYLAYSWAERDKTSFDVYVKSYLDKNPDGIIQLIKAYVPTVRSTGKPKPYKGDLTKERYVGLVSVFDKKMLYRKIIMVMPLEELSKEKCYWGNYDDKDFTDINMLRQYLHWYNEETKDSK
jgi:predicted KAP-like P-loop ATPase